MPDLVISEFMDQAAVDGLAAQYDTVYDPTLVDDPERLAAFVGNARGLIVRNRTQVRQELLDSAPALLVVGRLGVGLDNIDLEACKQRRVEVCPATGANDLAVAEYVVAATLVLLRGAYQAFSAMTAGDWPRTALIGGEASGKQIGLIGFGGIARQVATRLKALGMTIAAHDPYLPGDDQSWQQATNLSLEDLLTNSDVISLHVPLTEGTRNLINAERLAAMKPGALLINTARGGVVDEPALAEALRSGHLGGAALDVFTEEPLSAEMAAPFQNLPNLILTPHIAGVTKESNIRVSAVTAENVRRVLGEVP